MKTLPITIELLSWWHAGSGMGRGGDVDALAIRNRDELPYLPGKTLKGLMRDAVRLAEDFKHVPEGSTDILFGAEDPRDRDSNHSEKPGRQSGLLMFTDGCLAGTEAKWLREGEESRRASIFERFSSTSMSEEGLALDKTLRRVEVCPPMVLETKVSCRDEAEWNKFLEHGDFSGPNNPTWDQILKNCLGLIRALGSHRHRGLGRCRFLPGAVTMSQSGVSPSPLPAAIKEGCVWLEIELLTDVVLSANAATTGGHDRLEYLPGSALLGVAAGIRSGALFKQLGPEVFLSGKVRFGDGLPLLEEGRKRRPAFPMPFNLSCYKKEGIEGKIINNLRYSEEQREKDATAEKQLQQLRSGYLTADRTCFSLAGDYLLKTARSREEFGRPDEARLFGYSTLRAGERFLAALRWPRGDSKLTEAAHKIIETLTQDEIRLGRSRSAQFGRAVARLIDSKNYSEAAKQAGAQTDQVHFYLVSDLALTRNGVPSLTCQASDFNLPIGWEYQPERSYVRTRRYSPWNNFHHTRMTERQVLQRGSVLTFQNTGRQGTGLSDKEFQSVHDKLADGIGEHRQDGLGHVLLNPDFVTKGWESLAIHEPDLNAPASASKIAPDTPFIRRVQRRAKQREQSLNALKNGQKWADKWVKMHKEAAKGSGFGRSGTSQWNQIRQFAIAHATDRVALLTKIKEFCRNGLRRRFWEYQFAGKRPRGEKHDVSPQSLADRIESVIQDQTIPAPLAARSLAVAAELIIHRLQKERL